MAVSLNIAHRGASGAKPENTLEAFTHALGLGADGVELDVRRCKSGELVVIHDHTLKRTVWGSGRVSAMTCRELKAFEIRGGGTIPLLEEVFQAIGKQAYCFIELKEPKAAKDAAYLIKEYVKKGWRADRLILITFRHKALMEARKHNPALQIGASFKNMTPLAIKKAKAMGAEYIIPHFGQAGPKMMKLAHDAGLTTIVWTVNKQSDMQKLAAAGADGIMTDYPDKLKL